MKCIALRSSKNWGLYVKDAIIDVNTRCVHIHGYTPSEILLGFDAVTSRENIIGEVDNNDNGQGNWTTTDDIPTADEDTIHVYIDRRSEISLSANERLAQSQDSLRPKVSPGYKKPKAGDLVLVHNIQLAKEKGKKLEPRWSTPRLLEQLSKSGVSGHVRHLHDPPGKTKQFHIDDLVPYISRGTDPLSANIITPAVEYSRNAFGDVQGNWSAGQRAFNLGDVSKG